MIKVDIKDDLTSEEEEEKTNFFMDVVKDSEADIIVMAAKKGEEICKMRYDNTRLKIDDMKIYFVYVNVICVLIRVPDDIKN